MEIQSHRDMKDEVDWMPVEHFGSMVDLERDRESSESERSSSNRLEDRVCLLAVESAVPE
jgi:hypothetical protein